MTAAEEAESLQLFVKTVVILSSVVLLKEASEKRARAVTLDCQ